MSEIFIKILNMSLAASWFILAVILFRAIFGRAPKWISCLLWAIVGIRLVMPFSLESALSLIPSNETVPHNIIYMQTPAINSGIGVVDGVVNPVLSDLSPAISGTRGIIAVLTDVAAWIWVVGIALMLSWGAFSYLRLYIRVRPSIRLCDNIYYCDNVDTPFILGIIKPKIYIPSGMDGERLEYVLEHEKAHLARKDHLFKPIGFCLLALYWFNPAIWVAYILLCRDIEGACDERVIRNMSEAAKKGYSEALVACSVHRRSVMACPLAFGEVGVKDRIKSVLNYKKPAFWIVIISLVLCTVLGICFLTDRKSDSGIESQKSYSELKGVELELLDMGFDTDNPYLKIKWKNKGTKSITLGEEFYLYRNVGGEWVDCRGAGDYYWDMIAYEVLPLGNFDHNYYIGDMDIRWEGKYRFVSKATIDGVSEDVYLDFVLSKSEISIDEIKKREDFKVVDQRRKIVSLTVPLFTLPETIYSEPSDSFMTAVYMDNFTTIYLEEVHYREDELLFDFVLEYHLKDNESGSVLSVLEWKEDSWTTAVGIPEGRVRDENTVYEDALHLVGQGPGEHFCVRIKTDVLKAAKGSISFTIPLNMVTYVPKDFDGTVAIAEETYTPSYGLYDGLDVTAYVCTDSAELSVKPSLILYNDRNRFSFTISPLSSYIAVGGYERSNDGYLILTTSDEYAHKYVFKETEDGLVFVASESASLPKYTYSKNGEPETPVPDGALFKKITVLD